MGGDGCIAACFIIKNDIIADADQFPFWQWFGGKAVYSIAVSPGFRLSIQPFSIEYEHVREWGG